MDYIVESDSITGIRGKKYFKGQNVKTEFFHSGHAAQLEKSGFLSKLSLKGKQVNKENS